MKKNLEVLAWGVKIARGEKVREIKFRAWFIDGKSKTMSGQVCSMQDDRTLFEFIKSVEDCKTEHGYNYILMQFTGLCDKYGEEIYEGDILTCEHYKKTREFNNFVTFIEGMFCINPNKKLHQTKRPLYMSLQMASEANNDYEIIGNLYENPELLNKEE